MTTSAIYLHHERSTKATAEADAQNREIVLDKTNLAPLGRFNDGTLFHGVTEEKPTVALSGTLTVTGATALNSTLSAAALSTLTGGAVVTAATDSASKLQVGGSESRKVQALTTGTTLDTTHNTLECNATAGSFVVTLPAAAGCTGRRYAFHKNDTSANTVTIDANAAETIDGAATIVLGGNVGNSHLVIVSNGTNWRIEWLYEEGTYTGTLTGMTTSPTITVRYIRSGKMIGLAWTTGSGTSAAGAPGTAFTITGMPAHLWPVTQVILICGAVISNNTIDNVLSNITISTAGVMSPGWCDSVTGSGSFYKTTYTSGGTKGITAGSVSYPAN